MSAIRFGKPWPTARFALVVIVAVAVSVAIPVALSFGQPRTHDHGRNLNVKVEIEGVDAGSFACVGFSVEREVVEFRSGDDSSTVRKVPGRLKYGDITLKRGYLPAGPLAEWVETSLTGPGADASGARRNGSIVIYDTQWNEVARFNFVQAWPSRWEISGFGEPGKGGLIEEVTLVVERIERVGR